MKNRIPLRYVAGRLFNLVAVVWLAATINFLLPRLSSYDPVLEYLQQHAADTGQRGDAIRSMVDFYRAWAGLSQPLWRQYLTYLHNMLRFDFGRSFLFFQPVTEIIMRFLPYTVALLSVATVVSFVVGTGLGAWAGWRREAKLFKGLVPIFMVLSSIPPFLIALILLYFLAFKIPLFPSHGAYSVMISIDWSNGEFLLDVARHAVLPILAMVLVTGGTWALWMRGMIVTVVGEDYMQYADAKGLKPFRRFYHYAVRNVMLPQATQLAISLGTLVSGYTLVETMFGYPGVGQLLYEAILANDYGMIQGIVFFLIVAIALATFLLDLSYPLLDPRISYHQSH